MSLSKKPIWFDKDITLQDLQSFNAGTMGAHLGMQWVELGPDFLKIRMPVDERTRQPYGVLHGGASCSLAETAGSIGAYLVIDNNRFICMGMEINANHIRPVRQGFVIATASPVHTGATTHVWDIRIHDEQERLVCISRLTVAIRESKNVKY